MRSSSGEARDPGGNPVLQPVVDLIGCEAASPGRRQRVVAVLNDVQRHVQTPEVWTELVWRAERIARALDAKNRHANARKVRRA